MNRSLSFYNPQSVVRTTRSYLLTHVRTGNDESMMTSQQPGQCRSDTSTSHHDLNAPFTLSLFETDLASSGCD